MNFFAFYSDNIILNLKSTCLESYVTLPSTSPNSAHCSSRIQVNFGQGFSANALHFSRELSSLTHRGGSEKLVYLFNCPNSALEASALTGKKHLFEETKKPTPHFFFMILQTEGINAFSFDSIRVQTLLSAN